jgi:hypothetical protein
VTKLYILPLLLILTACSKSAPTPAEDVVGAASSDKEIKESAKSIDDAANEAAEIVESEANEEVEGYNEAEPDVDLEGEPEEGG